MSEPSRDEIAAKLLGVNPDTLHWSDYGYETQQHYLRMADVAIAALCAAKPERERVIEALDAADFYLMRLNTALCGKPVRDMDEASERWLQASMKVRRALKGDPA